MRLAASGAAGRGRVGAAVTTRPPLSTRSALRCGPRALARAMTSHVCGARKSDDYKSDTRACVRLSLVPYHVMCVYSRRYKHVRVVSCILSPLRARLLV